VAGELFKFWFYHREAIYTLIYVYLVLKKRNLIVMAGEWWGRFTSGYGPFNGSGMTNVISLA